MAVIIDIFHACFACSFIENLFRQPDLPGYLEGERASRFADIKLEKRLHEVVVESHCAVDNSVGYRSEIFEICIMGSNHTKNFLFIKLRKYGFSDRATKHRLRSCSEFIDKNKSF